MAYLNLYLIQYFNSAWRDNTIDNSSVKGVKRIESANNAGCVAVGPENEENSGPTIRIKYHNANDFNDTSSRVDVHRKQKQWGI